jgi:uncharacterized protein (TIGR03790 family)
VAVRRAGLLSLALALHLVPDPGAARTLVGELGLDAGVQASTLAVVVNRSDPVSVAVGEHYRARRGLPPENVIEVSFEPGRAEIPPEELGRLRAEVEARVPPGVQAYALAWTLPFRAGCLSITTAFAAGFDPAFCGSGCVPTRESPYFNSDASLPHAELGWRPTMLLAGRDLGSVRRLIDRGVAADGTRPPGTGYLLSTSDPARNVRAMAYPEILERLRGWLRLERLDADELRDRDDVLFYFTGRARVAGLETLRFRPGAVADHLTSSGGILSGSDQMSSLEWLDAGATASYGTVVEPCAFPQKFPHPGIVMARLLRGETLLEAYWKSVAWPGQGVFLGEPLARPWPAYRFVPREDSVPSATRP